ncbi:MAG: DUF1501 domain-containing protein [Planctomycetes bacterium]|nr:DUF1501 domain-containing protein [Planctomycetota bacterium]
MGRRKDLQDRREFLKRCCSITAGGLAGFYGLSNSLQLANAAVGPGGEDYRALVCIFLFGGNDSWNMFVPRDNTNYGIYAASRQNLAIPQGNLIAVAPAAPVVDYGFHPDCSGLANLFNNGNLSVVANVGTLLEPTTKAQYDARSVALPPQLFSHNTQTQHWQTSRPDSTERTGWCGRVADLLSSVDPSAQVAMNISIFGNNVQQTGATSLPYNVNSNGVPTLTGINDNNTTNAIRKQAFESILNMAHQHRFAREYANVQTRALNLADTIATELSNATPLNTQFPNSSLGRQLAQVARLIRIRGALGRTRQIYFVGAGGWDTHGQQGTRQPQLLGDLSNCMQAFFNATVEMGIEDNVTTFTGSDFGRTLTSNGDGSDHGWGGHSLVMGGCVNGQRIFGTLPTLEIGGPDDTRGGRLIPTTSVDQYVATLARWYGVPQGQISTVVPNVTRFATDDLGFMQLIP